MSHELLGPYDTLDWSGRRRTAPEAVSAPAVVSTPAPEPVVVDPSPTVHVHERILELFSTSTPIAPNESAAIRQTLREMPDEERRLLLRYVLRSAELCAALLAGQWDVVLTLASKPLPFEGEEKVRLRLHAWLTQRPSPSVAA